MKLLLKIDRMKQLHIPVLLLISSLLNAQPCHTKYLFSG